MTANNKRIRPQAQFAFDLHLQKGRLSNVKKNNFVHDLTCSSLSAIFRSIWLAVKIEFILKFLLP